MEQIKLCKKCNEVKRFPDNFHRHSSSKDGYHSYCKRCTNEYTKNRRANNIQVREYQRAYLARPEVRERLNQKRRERYSSNSEYREAKLQECLTRRSKPGYFEQQSEYMKEYYSDPSNRERKQALGREYRSTPGFLERKRKNAAKPENRARDKAYNARPENQERKRVWKRKYEKNRQKNDVNFRLSVTLRKRIVNAVRSSSKSGSSVRDLGCSGSDLRNYLQSLFAEGMSWNNWGNGSGKWNIDHIMPLSAFNLEDRQHFLLANCYLNLQPLWFEDNLRKGKRIIKHESPQDWGLLYLCNLV